MGILVPNLQGGSDQPAVQEYNKPWRIQWINRPAEVVTGASQSGGSTSGQGTSVARVLLKPGLPASLPGLLSLIYILLVKIPKSVGAGLVAADDVGPRQTSHISHADLIPALLDPWGPGVPLTS